MNNWQKLKWLILSGITESIGEEPVNRLERRRARQPDKVNEDNKKAPEIIADTFVEQATILASQAKDLSDLYEKRSLFDGCPLKKTAAYTLNGYGVAHPDVLCLVEAPDTIDDREGKLMSGEAGDLLGKMLAAIHLNLNENAYISSLIPWRPPGNRKPSEIEQAVCRPFWEREIQLLQPKLLLLFGTGVSGALLGINSLAKARNTWHDYHGIPTRVSIPPATLLNVPTQKKQAWEDLKQVQEKLMNCG